jgi:TonB family protein
MLSDMRWLALFVIALAIGVAQEPSTHATRSQPRDVYLENGVTAPRLIYKEEPEYSETAREAVVDGTVMVDPDGTPRDLKVIRPIGFGLDEKAIEAFRRWKFKPGVKDGLPIAVPTKVEVNFGILDNKAAMHLERFACTAPEGVPGPSVLKSERPASPARGERVSVTLSFDVDERGIPANLHVEKISDEKWEAGMIASLKEWRFNGAVKDGRPVLVPCTLSFSLGEAPSGPPGKYSNITPPQIIHKVQPTYTKEAAKAKLEGTVMLLVVVDQEGIPRDLRVTRPLGGGLDEKALEAVRQWRFRPGMKDGKPVAVQTYVQVNFHMR